MVPIVYSDRIRHDIQTTAAVFYLTSSGVWTFRPFVSTVGNGVSGATVWNDLPLHVASAPSLAVIRRRLKTFLFSRSYQDTIIRLVLLLPFITTVWTSPEVLAIINII